MIKLGKMTSFEWPMIKGMFRPRIFLGDVFVEAWQDFYDYAIQNGFTDVSQRLFRLHLPHTKKVFPRLISQEFASVQPMIEPTFRLPKKVSYETT